MATSRGIPISLAAMMMSSLAAVAAAVGCDRNTARTANADGDDARAGVDERPYTIADAVADGAPEEDLSTLLEVLGNGSGPLDALPELAPGVIKEVFIDAPKAAVKRCSERTFDVRSVGAIVRPDHGRMIVLCSATAISATTIVTARHCIEQLGDAKWYFTTDEYAKRATLTNALQKPLPYPNPAIDLAIMHITPALTIPLEAYPKLGPSGPLEEAPILKVGYGYWTDPRSGLRTRSVGTKTCALMSVRVPSKSGLPYRYDYDPYDPPGGEICDRDSGGPAFHRGRPPDDSLYILGVTKSTWMDLKHDKDCGTGGSDTQIPSADGEHEGATTRRDWLAQQAEIRS